MLAEDIPSLAAQELLATPKGALMVVPSPEGRRLSSSYSSPRLASSSLQRKPPLSRKPYSLLLPLPPIPPPLPCPPRPHPRPRPLHFPLQSRPPKSLASPPIISSSPSLPPPPPPLPKSVLPPSPPSLMSTLTFLDAIDSSVTSITYLISMCGNHPVSDVGVRGGVCLNLGHALQWEGG